MNERMKILIAYDGSECADAALDDLKRAGLPGEVEARILMITEGWMTPPPDEATAAKEGIAPLARTPDFVQQMYAQREGRIVEAKGLVEMAQKRVRGIFPAWSSTTEARVGSPATEIIAEANEWKPDLIVVGSHGRTMIGRLVLGSISQKTLTEADCSVRIARRTRARSMDNDSPLRLIIGIDGSLNAEMAVAQVANRSWATGTAVRLVTATKAFHMYGTDPVVQEQHTQEIQRGATMPLEATGLLVSSIVREGDPKRVLIEAAREWDADTIFIGAKGHSFLERTLLGSVSYAVAARAACTVEVVRPRK